MDQVNTSVRCVGGNGSWQEEEYIGKEGVSEWNRVCRFEEAAERWNYEGATVEQRAIFEKEQIHFKDGSEWWEEYKQQRCVIMRDFDGGTPLQSVLYLMDSVPHGVTIRKGVEKFNSERVLITAEKDPRYWYDFVPEGKMSMGGRRPQV